jgi:hypothetical protein
MMAPKKKNTSSEANIEKEPSLLQEMIKSTTLDPPAKEKL